MKRGEIIFDEWQPLWNNQLVRVALPLTSMTAVVTVVALSFQAPASQRPLLWGVSVGIVLVDLAVLFGFSLRVRVDALDVRTRFRPFWTRRIARGDIMAADAVTYDALGQYGGWGIKHSRKFGRSYTVAGDRGVLLTLRDGSMVLLGSKRSEELAAILKPTAAGSEASGV